MNDQSKNYPTAQGLTAALGGRWVTGTGRAPCPAHAGKDSNLAISEGRNGIPVLHCHSHKCDFEAIVGALRDRNLWPGANPQDWTPSSPVLRRNDSGSQADDLNTRIKIAVRQWRETIPLPDTLSDRYLRQVRGRNPDGVTCLRHHAGIFHTKTDKAPAMVASIQNVHTGEVQGVHRTFLNMDGTKIARTMKGKAKDGAIMLDPHDAPTTGLAVCEGLEDGLAIRQYHGPVWALMDAGNIASFPVLAGIETLTIFADRDDTGMRAAKDCRRRWEQAGCEVIIKLPVNGKDADEMLS